MVDRGCNGPKFIQVFEPIVNSTVGVSQAECTVLIYWVHPTTSNSG